MLNVLNLMVARILSPPDRTLTLISLHIFLISYILKYSSPYSFGPVFRRLEMKTYLEQF